MKYKVSVIIPVYNVGRYIEKCARSLFEQSLDDIEYIFVDDCSPDNSLSIVKFVSEDYPKRKNNIKYLVHDKNRGLTTTRNTGLAVATGEFIAHCDSDDWVDVAMYEKLYNHAVEENADVCFSNFNFVYGNRSETYECTSVYVDKISKQKKLLSFRINSKVENYDAPIIERQQPPVESWLRAFYDAEYIITDSFHACVFSILFHKPFICIGNKARGMSRFDSLLSAFDLCDRLVDIEGISDYVDKEIEWEHVDRVLMQKRQEALKYLGQTLQN